MFKRVSIDRADVRDVLAKLFGVYGIPYHLAPEVDGTVTLELRNVRFSPTLNAVLKQVDAYFQASGLHAIYPQKPVIALDLFDQSFELGLKRMARFGYPSRVDHGAYYLVDSQGREVAFVAPPQNAQPTAGSPPTEPAHPGRKTGSILIEPGETEPFLKTVSIFEADMQAVIPRLFDVAEKQMGGDFTYVLRPRSTEPSPSKCTT